MLNSTELKGGEGGGLWWGRALTWKAIRWGARWARQQVAPASSFSFFTSCGLSLALAESSGNSDSVNFFKKSFPHDPVSFLNTLTHCFALKVQLSRLVLHLAVVQGSLPWVLCWPKGRGYAHLEIEIQASIAYLVYLVIWHVAFHLDSWPRTTNVRSRHTWDCPWFPLNTWALWCPCLSFSC